MRAIGLWTNVRAATQDHCLSGRERRRFARVSLDAQVSVSVSDSDRLFNSRIRDLSQSGVFILTDSTRPIGTGVTLKIAVAKEGVEFEARGIIVHEVNEGPEAGVGVMFTNIADFDALIQLIAMGVLL